MSITNEKNIFIQFNKHRNHYHNATKYNESTIKSIKNQLYMKTQYNSSTIK